MRFDLNKLGKPYLELIDRIVEKGYCKDRQEVIEEAIMFCYKKYFNINQYNKPSWAVKQLYRENGLLEDICKHGVGHPNKQWLETDPVIEGQGIHGCDGYCNK